MSKVKILEVKKSKMKGKKYLVIFEYKNKVNKVNFGSINHEHYFDKFKMYSNLNHNDKKRRESFRKRFKGIKLKNGELAINSPLSGSYWSYRYLW